jgi:hypothetical protein
MSAWVAPSIAAEIWGISVNDVLAGIADGSIQSYVDGQFLFVDLGRHGLPLSTPRPVNTDPIVTHEEIAALTFTPIMSEPQPSLSEGEDIVEDSPDEGRYDVGQWRSARRQTSQVRRPPASRAA